MDWFLPADEIDDETWDRVMAVDATGPFKLCRAVLPSMRQRGSGAIVNAGSAASVRGGTAGVAYTMSKHAVLGLTRSIAWVYATLGIRCNVVLPGGVETNIGTTAVEIASLVSWLGSDEASNINSAVIDDDGGWRSG